MSAYYRSISGYNWADDEEDDFDVEAFRRSSTCDAPTLEEMGPLQDSADKSLTFSSHRTSIAEVSTSNYEISSPFESAPQVPDPYTTAPLTDPANWPFAPPTLVDFRMDKNEVSEPPAYELLSSRVGKRCEYAAHWRDFKVNCRGFQLPRGETFMVAKSKMDCVWNACKDVNEEEDEIVKVHDFEVNVDEIHDYTDISSGDDTSADDSASEYSSDEGWWEEGTAGTITPPEVTVSEVDSAKSEDKMDAASPPAPVIYEDTSPDVGYVAPSSFLKPLPREKDDVLSPNILPALIWTCSTFLVWEAPGWALGIAAAASLFTPRR